MHRHISLLIILVIMAFSLAATITGCKTLMAQNKTTPLGTSFGLSSSTQLFINPQSDNILLQNTPLYLILSLLYKYSTPMLAIIALLTIFSLFRLYYLEKARKYTKPLSDEDLFLIQGIKDDAERIWRTHNLAVSGKMNDKESLIK